MAQFFMVYVWLHAVLGCLELNLNDTNRNLAKFSRSSELEYQTNLGFFFLKVRLF